jgi:hypothetical protein
MAIRCTSKPVMMSEARRICKSEPQARQIFAKRATRGEVKTGSISQRSEEQRELRTPRRVNLDMQLALAFGISACAVARLNPVPGAACQGSVL